jgi:hypothetical protein
MMLRYLIQGLLVLVFSASVQASEPFVMGHGRYLSAQEQEALFKRFRHTGPISERHKFAGGYQHLKTGASEQPPRVAVVEFTKFNVDTVFSSKLHKGFHTYMVCFNCEENIPAAQSAARNQEHVRDYDVWVLSGYFMIVEEDPRSRAWRVVLDHGAAE